MNGSRTRTRRNRRPVWIILGLTLCIGTGGWLYAQRDTPGAPLRRPAAPAGTLFHVHTATDRIDIRIVDAHSQWDWDWAAPDCLQALAGWVLAREIRALTLQLIHPETHPLGLPIRALYPEAHDAPGAAGAWCETRGSADRPHLWCSLAPLAGGHPGHVTVAAMGALAQAGAYAREGAVAPDPAESSESWARWRPLVQPGSRAGQWQSACPSLVPQTRRRP